LIIPIPLASDGALITIMVEIDAVYLPDSNFEEEFDPLHTDFALFTARAPEPDVWAMLLVGVAALALRRAIESRSSTR
jgi:MYXO-CTERM domain-containing protein